MNQTRIIADCLWRSVQPAHRAHVGGYVVCVVCHLL